MQNVCSVKKVNAYIKSLFTQDYVLTHLAVRGEVSNCKYHTSGHIYFSLKDESGSLACVMFASARKGLAFRIKDGQQVIVSGSVSVYERDGKYQLYAEQITPDGAGMLYERYEALKRELEETGMFSKQYKQPIPRFVRKLGVVTAPTGAAIRDIIHIARRRNPGIQIVLSPALVQGEGAAQSVAAGIRSLDAFGVDVIIAGRGGGSMEDLWAFNEEVTARAIFQCRTPVISAVGHETDVLISDYVADLRAPTPSAAAELAVLDVRSVQAELLQTRERLLRAVTQKGSDAREQVRARERLLRSLGPQAQIREKKMHLMDLETRLTECMEERRKDAREAAERRGQSLSARMEERLRDVRHRMGIYLARMKGLSPLDRLSLGYSCTEDAHGNKITKISQTKEGERIQVFVTDGRIDAEVLQTEALAWPDGEDDGYGGEERGAKGADA